MDDDSWRRHSNPWSVYTRLASIPLLGLAIWSRSWIGWWAVVPVVLVLLWLFINPRAFAPVPADHGWAARGIYGERLWLESDGGDTPRACCNALRWLTATGVVSVAVMLCGLVQLKVWPSLLGAVVLIFIQLWRIDRFGRLYEKRGKDGIR
jgi:hypothetical protein